MREKCRHMLEDIYLRLPPVRVWLYAKQLRHMLLRRPESIVAGFDPEPGIFDKTEDVMATGASLPWDGLCREI